MPNIIKYITVVCWISLFLSGKAYPLEIKNDQNDIHNDTSSLSSGSACEKAILRELGKVIDPEVNINVIDLGIIRKIQCDSQHKVNIITIILTSPLCPYLKTLVADMKAASRRALPDSDVKIIVDMKTRWSPALLSEEGKKHFMGQTQ